MSTHSSSQLDTAARRFPILAGRRGPVAEQMAAERELLGQLLTFCAFLGGLSLAAVVALFELTRPGLGMIDAITGEPVVMFAQILLSLTSISALSGAFFALLGFLNHNQMLERLAKVRHITAEEVDDRVEATVRQMVHKYANSLVFRQMARFLAVVAMAAALVGVISVSYLVLNWIALVLLVLAGMLLILPIFAAQALKYRLSKVPLETWLPNADGEAPAQDGDVGRDDAEEEAGG